MLLAFESVTRHKISSASQAPSECAHPSSKKTFQISINQPMSYFGPYGESHPLQLNAIQQARSDLQYNLNEELASFPISNTPVWKTGSSDILVVCINLAIHSENEVSRDTDAFNLFFSLSEVNFSLLNTMPL